MEYEVLYHPTDVDTGVFQLVGDDVGVRSIKRRLQHRDVHELRQRTESVVPFNVPPPEIDVEIVDP